MNKIIKKRERDPQIIFPTQIIEKEYVGELKGYYVANTNCYNVLPFDEAVEINENKIHSIGYIFPANPFADKEIASQIKFLKTEESSPDDMVRKMQHALQNPKTEGPETDFKGEEYYTDSNSIVGYWEDKELHFVQLKSLRECKQEKYSLKLDVFSRNTGILESDIMMEKGALFIGCGSVGSLFALELAKAGVGRFLLIDNDIFGYHNICRHQCGIYDVGRFKTDALKERILQVNPYAKVVAKNMIIQEVPLAELVEFCDKNTIVIGGADNREGDLYANNIAQQIEMPFMSIGCWERAFAGEIFYCLPRNMPNYLDFMEVTGLLSARVNQNRQFYTTEEELEKIAFEPGISADINFVTIIAVKMALDILNIGNENYTQRLLPHLTQYTLVCNTNNTKIGGERAELFSYPLQVSTSIIVPYSNQ